MNDLLRAVEKHKAELDAMRPLDPALLATIERPYEIELTYTSNAIEGNTLTLRETAEVIEHGITIGGKPLRDHLEARDHDAALVWMRSIARADVAMSEMLVRELHRRIVIGSQPAIAGIYSTHRRRVAGSAAIFPNPLKVPELMERFGHRLSVIENIPNAAFDIHFELAAIHPFADGNGRTARLLMNLVLIRGGYRPVAVRPVDRLEYLRTLEIASVSGDLGPFRDLMYVRLEETMREFLEGLREGMTR